MADFTVGGFWLFDGTDFSVTTSTGDVNIEGFGLARFDSAFGGSGNVSIANSNATHLQLGNIGTAIDITCTTFTHNGSGQFSVNASAVQLSIGGVGVLFADSSQVVVGEAGKTLLDRGTTWTGSFSGLANLVSSNEFEIQCINGGNTATVDLFNDGTMTISATTQVLIATLSLDLNTANTNPINISNVSGAGSIALNAATITAANLPGSAPGGSVAVMWDPTGKRFYHA